MAFAGALPSLAGIPLTVGFIAKFHAMAAGVGGGHGVLLGTLVAGSVIGLYYYPTAPRPSAATFGPSRSVMPCWRPWSCC